MSTKHQFNKIFEIGMPRTGTTSLGRAFELLGLRHKGWSPEVHYEVTNGFIEPAMELIERFDAFEDGPWHNIDFRVLDERFPGSKFIILDRDDETWYASMQYHFLQERPAPWFLRQTKEKLLALKDKKYREIRDYFRERPQDLLVMNIVNDGDGWDKLCPFLGLPVPVEPFPNMVSRRVQSRGENPYSGNITVLIPHFNEPFIKECVLSVAPYVAEVVVADSGSDEKYRTRLDEAARQAGNVRVFDLDMREKPLIAIIRAFLDSKCETEWCLSFDGDCIAYDDERSLGAMFKLAGEHPGYDQYAVKTPWVAGDVNHTFAKKELHKPRCRLYRSGSLEREIGKWNDDEIVVRGQTFELPGHYWISTHLKPLKRLVYRVNMDRYAQENKDPSKDYWDWIFFNKSGRFPETEREKNESTQGTINWHRRQLRYYDRYNFGKWGPHPWLFTRSSLLEDYKLTSREDGYTLEAYPVDY